MRNLVLTLVVLLVPALGRAQVEPCLWQNDWFRCPVKTVTPALAKRIRAQRDAMSDVPRPIELELTEAPTATTLVDIARELPEVQAVVLGPSVVEDVVLDLTPLTSCKALTRLEVERVASVAPLTKLTRLTELRFTADAVDLAPLGSLAQLKILRLFRTSASELGFLSRLHELEHLYVSGQGQPMTIPRLGAVDGIRSLSIASVQLVSLSFLADLHQLVELSLDACRLTLLPDFAKLGLARLQKLSLGENPDVTDWHALAQLPQLEVLSLRKNSLRDLAPLTKLARLQHLNLSMTSVDDLSPLCGLPALRNLMLDATRVRSLAPLESLQQLGVLTVADTPVRDFSPLFAIGSLLSLGVDKAQKATPSLQTLAKKRPQLRIR